jgi:hypothetical protein
MEKHKWRVISETATSKVLEYRSPGRRYILSISYALYGQELRLLNIILEGNKKKYAFPSIDDLKSFLSKRKIPLPAHI